jgi:hypothetical protein
MWIDNRTGDIKVYETQPSDPYIKNMTWVPREGAWVLFNPGPSPERFREFIEKHSQCGHMMDYVGLEKQYPDVVEYLKKK